jgi:putative nucleotidyltransferase with HDIG domain
VNTCLPITSYVAVAQLPFKNGVSAKVSQRGRQRAELDQGFEGAQAAQRLPNHTLSDLLIPISGAIDLAEGRPIGHARRVAYIALRIASTIGLDTEQRLACLYAGLFHDIGVIPAGAGLSELVRGDERRVFSALPLLTPEEAAVEVRASAPDIVVDRVVDHAVHGARHAQELGLPQAAVRAIACHHEQWDGSGYPHGIAGNEIPIAARITSVADQVEALVDQESSPLHARRNMPHWLARFAATVAEPELLSATRALTAGDSFWLGLYGPSLAAELRAECGRLKEQRSPRLLTFAERFSEVMDNRFGFTVGVSSRVAKLSEALGRSIGLPEYRLKLLRIAALLHDVGQLGVPERIMAKPGILSVDELEVLRQHPAYSREIVADIPGLEQVADWVGCHHEWADGRGYPEGRTAREIPLEARILAIADAYVGMTSDRPHRRRMEPEDSLRRLRGASGSQFDPDLLSVFAERVAS